jgi:hypothetical protein
VVLLGLLVLVALFPIIPEQRRGYPLVLRLAAIVCAFAIGQIFKSAATTRLVLPPMSPRSPYPLFHGSCTCGLAAKR